MEEDSTINKLQKRNEIPKSYLIRSSYFHDQNIYLFSYMSLPYTHIKQKSNIKENQMERVIEFEKYHGLGNDFIIIDNREGIFSTDKKDIEQLAKIVIDLCDRHTGIGSDGIMFVENVSTENDKNIELI